MLQFNDVIITANISDIILQLKLDLDLKYNVQLFETIKDIEDNIQTNCPFHKGGKERKPSFGINVETGVCHCFTCGWSGSLDDMISQIFNKNDWGEFGRKWLIKHFNSYEVEKRPQFQIEQRNKLKKAIDKEYITEEELDKYRFIHPYHYKRHLTDDILDRFDIGYDVNTDCITFPVKDVEGNCVFVARRGVKNKYFNYPSGSEKPVYLANLFKDGKYKSAVICEGFLDALIFWKYNIPAMALMGLGSSSQYEILRKLPVRKYILALDPDNAGRTAQQRFRNILGNSKIITELQYIDDKDINELDKDILKLKEIL